jgi:alkane 1-monooxygenase
MNNKALKYLLPGTLYALAFLSFTKTGFMAWLPLIYAWLLIPLAELLIAPDNRNLTKAEEDLHKTNRAYDYVLYLFVVLQFTALAFFLTSFERLPVTGADLAARIATMGMLCGTFGINIGHELGHRSNRFEQMMAKASLMTSLYMHFFIEHNKGHHKNVATPEDPNSARYNEPVYLFYIRSIRLAYRSAWKIASGDMRKKGRPWYHPGNEMLQAQFIQIAFVSLILVFFGTAITLYFLGAAFIGILLLETVNYIEHYGLSRKETAPGKYERAMPHHSWNSNHILGRLMLFELSRHSDHHYLASRKYQVLRHHENAPQLPTGYPGSILLSLIPPLWFQVMNRKIRDAAQDQK